MFVLATHSHMSNASPKRIDILDTGKGNTFLLKSAKLMSKLWTVLIFVQITTANIPPF